MQQSPEKDQPGCYPVKFSKSYSSHSDVSLEAKEEKKDRKVFKPKKDQGYSHLERASSEEELVDGQLRSKPKKAAKVFGKLKAKNKTSTSCDDRPSPQIKNLAKNQYSKHGVKSRSASDSISQLATRSIDRPVFGLPLKDALRNNPSHDGVPVPAMVRMCIDCVNERGMKIEGIYRLSPVKSKIDELKQFVDFGPSQVDLLTSLDDPLCAATLLKTFLRKLPENLLTVEFQADFEHAVEKSKTIEDCRERLKILVTHLPPANRTLLAYLFLHMRQVIDNADYNKMPLANVGLVLQPVLNFSQSLLSCFLQHPNSLFSDIKIKRYVPPITATPSKFAMEFPNCIKDIEEELVKQESLLNFIHENIKFGYGGDSKTEEELWDVQRLMTQLKRELKKLKKHHQNSPLPFSDHGGQENNQPALCLEMFEEKQLLAIQMEILDGIEAEQKMISSLNEQLKILKADHALISPENMCVETDPDEDVPEDEWIRLCEIEEQRKEKLLSHITDERNLCANIRAQIEMLQLEKPENFEATRL